MQVIIVVGRVEDAVEFPISGVEISPLVPVLVGFAVATVTTPAGVSGAFLLLPFQFSVLGFTTPGVTATNLLYNVISTPGGILRFRSQGSLDLRLARAIASGAAPGVIAGSVLRVTIFSQPGDFKIFVGLVLGALGSNLLAQASFRHRSEPSRDSFSAGAVSLLGAGAGVIGGIYGVSGGSIVAPVLAGVFGLSVRRVASAALLATLITSATGVLSFLVLNVTGAGGADGAAPDLLLALLFGIGGIAGSYLGARINRSWPERLLRIMLGLLALALATSYIAPVL